MMYQILFPGPNFYSISSENTISTAAYKHYSYKKIIILFNHYSYKIHTKKLAVYTTVFLFMVFQTPIF